MMQYPLLVRRLTFHCFRVVATADVYCLQCVETVMEILHEVAKTKAMILVYVD